MYRVWATESACQVHVCNMQIESVRTVESLVCISDEKRIIWKANSYQESSSGWSLVLPTKNKVIIL